MSDVNFALAQVRDRDLVIESLREQLEDAGRQDGGGWPCACEFEPDEQKDPLVECLYHEEIRKRAEAAEAKLAEDAHRNDQLKRERDKYRAKLAEIEKERDALVRAQYKANLRAASMDRARELAEKASDENTEYHTMPEIARLLSGDESQ